jgi:hypothetical protein
VDVSDSPTDLEELFVLLNSFLVLSKVIEKDSSRVVGPSLVSALACSFTSKCQDFVVFEPLLGSDTVVRVGIRHVQGGVVGHR